MNEVLSLSKFDDIKNQLNELFVNVEFYKNSEIARVAKLAKPTKFDIFGKEIVECEGCIAFYEGGELEEIKPVVDDTYYGYTKYVGFFENGEIQYCYNPSYKDEYSFEGISVKTDRAVEEETKFFFGEQKEIEGVYECYDIASNGKRFLSELHGELRIKRKNQEYDKRIFTYLRFNDKQHLIGYKLDGRYYDLERERQFEQNIIDDLMTGGNKIKEALETIKKITGKEITVKDLFEILSYE